MKASILDLETNPDGTKKQVSSAEAALNWQAENAVAQNKVLSKILNNQQRMAEAVTHTFSSSNSLIEDLKKKIKEVEQELTVIASTVKDLSVSFPFIGQKEKEKKQLLAQLQSMENSLKETTQTLPMQVHTPYQPRQLLYKDLALPLTSPFLPPSPFQNPQPLDMTHPIHNPFRTSGIFPSITNTAPFQPDQQANPQNNLSKKREAI